MSLHSQVQRDGRPVSQGGDFIESGVEYSLEDLGLDPDHYYYYYSHFYSNSFTVYAELVKPSDVVAGLPVKIEVKPTANLGYVFSDQLRFTGVASRVLRGPLGGTKPWMGADLLKHFIRLTSEELGFDFRGTL